MGILKSVENAASTTAAWAASRASFESQFSSMVTLSRHEAEQVAPNRDSRPSASVIVRQSHVGKANDWRQHRKYSINLKNTLCDFENETYN